MPVTSISPGNCPTVRPGSDPAERFGLTTGQVPARSRRAGSAGNYREPTAEQVVADVALLHDLAAGKLDEQRARKAAEVLLEHRAGANCHACPWR